jgi:Ca2+-binding RTX toxin-like protein
MSVTRTYDFDSNNDQQDLNFGSAVGGVDITSLGTGGFAGIGNLGATSQTVIFNPSGIVARTVNNIAFGTNGAIDQLADGNLIIASQDSDSIVYKVIDAVTGADIVSKTDLNLPASSNADVVALNNAAGGFLIAYETQFAPGDRDINVAIRGSGGQFVTGFALDDIGADSFGPSLALLDNGNVVIAWTQTAGSETETWFAIRTAEGAVVKGPTLADTEGTINRNVTVTAVNGGGFALFYEDNQHGGMGTRSSMKRFDAQGANGARFDLDASFNSESVQPVATRLANGFLAYASIIDNQTTFIRLVDPATGAVLATRDVLDLSGGTNPTGLSITGFGTGRIAAVYSDPVANYSGGQAFNVVRNSTGSSIAGGPGDTINGDDFIDNMVGGEGEDRLNGQGNADILDGGGGNDIINGGTGADMMIGGSGNDSYFVDNGADTTDETTGDGTDTVFSSISYSVAAGIERLYLLGAANVNALGINGQADYLVGNAGNNRLDGLTGADYMRGGLGNDTYIVDVSSDLTDEIVGGGGIDTIISSIGLTLRSGIERLFLTGSGNINATGRGNFADFLVGNAGNNRLDGLTGADYMRGGLGNDTYIVDVSGDLTDEVTGGGGVSDTVLASANFTVSAGIERLFLTGSGSINATGRDNFADFLVGNSGNNRLNGLSGADYMRGGIGNDVYVVDHTGDITDEITGGAGIDSIVSSIGLTLRSGIERLFLSGSLNIDATGRAGLADFIVGNSGNNRLDGLSGADTMRGGLGNDSYFVDNSGDVTDEANGGGGNLDTVFASVDYTMSVGIERVFLTGTENIDVNGRADQADFIVGNSGKNVLQGSFGTGNDYMRGGLGDDTYFVLKAGDIVDEVTNGGGNDTIIASVTYTIARGVERLLTSVDTDGINLFGRDGQDDQLIGAAGRNLLSGATGADRLDGAAGNDTFTGGAGADIFLFTSALSSASNVDTVTDFELGIDRISLRSSIFSLAGPGGALAASAFKDLSLGAQDADDVILYDRATGNLFYDTNGLFAGGRSFFASVTDGLALTAASIFVNL